MENNKTYKKEVNNIIMALIQNKYKSTTVIFRETSPVFKTRWENLPKTRNAKKPLPLPLVVYLDYSIFKEQVKRNNFTETDAKYMYNSIDSTHIYEIDSTCLPVKVISKQLKRKSRTNNDATYLNCRSCSMILSTPVFNEDYSKAIINVDFSCGKLSGDGSILILKKIKGKWVIIDSYLSWIN